jgi:hypothetical protein
MHGERIEYPPRDEIAVILAGCLLNHHPEQDVAGIAVPADVADRPAQRLLHDEIERVTLGDTKRRDAVGAWHC